MNWKLLRTFNNASNGATLAAVHKPFIPKHTIGVVPFKKNFILFPKLYECAIPPPPPRQA